MTITCGVDLIYIPRFRKLLKRGGENFLRRVYLKQELKKSDYTHLAGVFAAKEAVIKALSLTTDAWHDIIVTYKPNGQPKTEIINYKSLIINQTLSISHDGNYVIAQFFAICKT